MENDKVQPLRIEPKLRFPGFYEPWEQRKLSTILEQRQIKQKISIEAPRLAFASGQGVIPLSERKTNNRDQLISDESKKKYLLTKFNDIVYNPANLKYGAIDRNKYGQGVISPIYVTFTTQEVPSYVERIVTRERFKSKALKFEEGTVVKRQSVNPENLLSLKEIISTSKEEQQKIGDFFDALDKLITLQQCKMENLNLFKKGIMIEVFSKHIETFPLVEMQEEITVSHKTKHLSKDSLSYGKYPFFTNNSEDFEKYFETYDVDGRYVIANTGGKAYFDFYEGKFAYMSDCYVFTTKANYDIGYLYQYLKFKQLHIDYVGFTGSGIKHLDKSWFAKFKIPNTPITIQKDISKSFANIDKKLNDIKSKIESLVQFKKGLLQQMFI